MAERQFGPYRLVRQIAVGGMAEIHLAKTRGIAGFEKFVALKMIHPNFAQDEQFIQMLIDEAKIAVQLQHVNIAQTFDLGRVGETYYITMEFVDGADLYKILRRGSEQDLDVPLDVCAYTAKEMATGLDYAHRKRDVHGTPLGIVHRDVSPQNVLISHAGEVKLVDFGIAKATMRARQTQVGVIKGKYYYMSPEQAWGDSVDHRSDIFSAGIVLYEMMTGQMLYLEEDLHKLLDMVRRADIAPPTTLRRDIPPQLERIVMHALEKRPEDRYQSAADLATDLERFLHVYSPVFTASKLTAHLRRAVGDPVPIAEAPAGAAVARSPHQATQPLDCRELVHERSEITDENSVIFRVDELQAQAQGKQRARAPTGAPRPRGDDESTAAELPRGIRRAQTGAEVPIPPPGRPRPPTQPPPRPGEPLVPTRVPGRVPTQVPAQIPTQIPGQPPGQRSRAPTQQPPGQRSRAPTQQPPGPRRPPTQPPPVRGRPATQPPPVRPRPEPKPPPRRAPTQRPAAAPPSREPGPAALGAPPRKILPASTMTLDAGDLADIEEMTAISEPPGFDSTVRTDGGALDFGDYEPTMIDAGETRRDPRTADADDTTTEAHEGTVDSDDGPTITRDGMGVPLPQPVQLSSSETVPRPHAEIRSKLRPGAPAHPALAAMTPTPAVSELRRPRGSRRTPPRGVPAGGSVLQAIVGAAAGEPMPTVPMRGERPAPASSDGVPRALPDGASSNAETVDAPGIPGPPPGAPAMDPGAPVPYGVAPIPGQHALPVAYGPPGYPPPPYPHPQAPYGPPQPGQPMPLVAPPTPPPGSMPSAQLPPHLVQYGGYGMPAAAQTISPAPQGYPYGSYGAPMSFTKQMQAAIELDELPQHLKFQENRSRRVVWAIVLVALFVGAIGITVMLTRHSTETRPATLVIESTPPGAIVEIDGVKLPEPTPARFETTPGSRHEIEVIAPRHKPWRQAYVVPASGGEVKVAAVLSATKTKLRINSQPGGAEIWINGELRGLTPRVLEDLDPSTATSVELRLKDYAPEVVSLDWGDRDILDVDVKFNK